MTLVQGKGDSGKDEQTAEWTWVFETLTPDFLW